MISVDHPCEYAISEDGNGDAGVPRGFVELNEGCGHRTSAPALHPGRHGLASPVPQLAGQACRRRPVSVAIGEGCKSAAPVQPRRRRHYCH